MHVGLLGTLLFYISFCTEAVAYFLNMLINFGFQKIDLTYCFSELLFETEGKSSETE
jgi:hypothetical protein